MHIACLDTESTSTGRYNEILELAIYSARGELVLNSLYKPKTSRIFRIACARFRKSLIDVR